jgi:hypothetical protein
MKLRFGLAGLAAAGAAAVVFVARPRYLRWGATPEESWRPLPGDDLIRRADLVATRAVTIHAPAARVWPWIAQMGQGRAGLYGYDALENLVGCDMHSADRIVPEWQDVAVGDAFRLHPDVPLEVVAVEPDRRLVIRGGVPLGDAPEAPFDFTWAFILEEPDPADGTTRLLVRERWAYKRWWARFMVEPVELGSFAMSQKMLRGIRERVETEAPAQAAPNAD